MYFCLLIYVDIHSSSVYGCHNAYVAVQIDRYGPHKSKMVVINICGFIHTELRKKDTFYIMPYLFRMLSNFSENFEQL